MAIETDTSQYTIVDNNTIILEKFKMVAEPYLGKPLLTPKEANQFTYSIIELLMSGNCDKPTLKLASRYFSNKAYEDLVEERIIEHYCGYPLCRFQDSKKIKDIQVNSLVTKLKLPRSYNTRFCCKKHYLCSEFYKRQLISEALFMRTQINLPWFGPRSFESNIILLDDYIDVDFDLKQLDVSESVDGIVKMLQDMKMEDPKMNTDELIDKFSSIKVVEHPGIQKSGNAYQNFS